jgi:prepilin-type N-terminal cleavage/methylation domain-containing protein
VNRRLRHITPREVPSSFRRAGSRRAFTLIELIVVLVIVGVIAGLAAPRIIATDRRRAETSVRAVAATLTALAQRSALSGDRSRLVYLHEGRAPGLNQTPGPNQAAGPSRDQPELRVESLRARGVDGPDEPERVWSRDPFTPPVRLLGVEIASAGVGPTVFEREDFTIDIVPGEPRPMIQLTIAEARAVAAGGTPRTWTVSLLPHETRARITGLRSGPVGADRPAPVDLDARGATEDIW